MSAFVDFMERIGDNTGAVLQKTADTAFSIANIPVMLAGSVSNIGNGIAGFLSSPLSGITIPILGIGALYIFSSKGK